MSMLNTKKKSLKKLGVTYQLTKTYILSFR